MFTLVNILIAAMLALGAGNVVQWWMWSRNVNSYKVQIQELQERNLQQEMTIKAKDKELADKEATAKVEKKVIYVQKEVDKMVESGDDVAMRRRFIERGMLPKDETGAPAVPRGDSGHRPAEPPGPAPVPSGGIRSDAFTG